jgi:hypothetical protein
LAPAIVEGATGGAHGVVDVFFGAGATRSNTCSVAGSITSR